MRKITKLLVLLLALVMVVSLFAGCKRTKNDPDETTAPSQGTEIGDVNAPVNNEMFPLEKPFTFRVAVQGQKEYQSMIERCEWYKYLREKTNVSIECILLGDDPVATLTDLISAKLPPDVVLGPDILSSAKVLELAKGGHLYELEKYITDEKIMPNYQRALKEVPELLKKATAPDGHIYSVAGLYEAPGDVWESPLSVNIEWLKKVPGYEDGKTFPKTIEEFTDVLRHFKKNDMNGNGDANDEIPFLMVSTSKAGDAQGTLQGLMNLWGLGTTNSANDYYVCVNNEGVCSLAPQTQNYRDCLKWINIWWQEGLIWEKFFDDVSPEEFAEIHGAETASWGFYNGSAWREGQTLVTPFNTGYDVNYLLNPDLQGVQNCVTIFKTCKKPEVVLAWLDQFYALTGSLSASSGMANEWERWVDSASYKDYYEKNPTWSVDENGNFKYPAFEDANWVDLNTVDATLAKKQSVNHPTWESIFDQHEVFKCITYNEHMSGQWKVDENSKTAILNKFIQENPDMFDYNVWPRPYASAEDAGELDFLWADIGSIISKYEKGFITGSIPLNDSNWNNFHKELELYGIKDMVIIMQSLWDRSKV